MSNNQLNVPGGLYAGSRASPNKGGISRAGDPSLYQQDDPNKLMYKETGAGVGAETFGRNLAKEREYERIKNQLKQEFSKIDFDNNGQITFNEVVRFLNEQTAGQVDTSIAEQIFAEIDEDQSGVILIEEFIDSYFEQQRQVKERILELEEQIKTNQKTREQFLQKLNEQRQNERLNSYGLDQDAILTIRVVEARDLAPMDITGSSDPYVVLKLGNQTSKTNFIKQNTNPVWNEIFTFDVESGKEILNVEVYDKDDFGSDDFEGQFALSLDELKDQQQHDEWFELEGKTPGQKWQGKVRLILQYVFSKTKMLTGYINMYSEQIEADEAELKDLKIVLKHMESPFGFIKGFQMEQKARVKAEERKQEIEEKKEELLTNWELSPELQQQLEQLEQKEKIVEEKVDIIAQNVAQRLGYENVPWYKLTWFLLWIYTILTLFVMFYRSDFINLTICLVALFMMFNTDTITRTRFRILVLGIFLTLLYDMFWFALKSQEYQEDLKSDGGTERNIRRFSLLMSYFSFILRILVAIVFWKDSMDFEKIIQHKREQDIVFFEEPKKQTTAPKNKNVYLRKQLQ